MRKMRFPLVWLATMALLAALTGATASAAGVCSTSTPQYCPRPTVTTGVATNIKSTSATLTGTVVANGASTECTFEYGTTPAYGSLSVLRPAGSGTTAVPVSATMTGLSTKAKFHYQLVCFNGGGTGISSDHTFVTLDHGKSHPTVGGKAGFVSSKGVVGFAIACFGDRKCAGKLSLTSHGKALAKARKYSIKSQRVRVVYLKLSGKQMRQLSRRHKLTGKLVAKDGDGPKTSVNVTLRRSR